MADGIFNLTSVVRLQLLGGEDNMRHELLVLSNTRTHNLQRIHCVMFVISIYTFCKEFS